MGEGWDSWPQGPSGPALVCRSPPQLAHPHGGRRVARGPLEGSMGCCVPAQRSERGPQGSLGVPSVMHVNSRNICIYLILNLMVIRKTQIRGGQVTTRQRTMQAPFKVEREALAA